MKDKDNFENLLSKAVKYYFYNILNKETNKKKLNKKTKKKKKD